MRTFSFLNLFLLFLVGGTCVVQWTRERDYAVRLGSLQSLSDRQQGELRTQADELKRTQEDVAGFKQTVANLNAQSEEQQSTIRHQKARVFELENESTRLNRQLETWRHAVEEHKAAIGQRDENIKTLLSQREQLVTAQNQAAQKANEAITAYNDLTKKYEDVVTRYNTLATQYKAEREAAAAAAK